MTVLKEEEIYKNLDLEDIEGEIWKDVVVDKGDNPDMFKGIYQVSNYGRLKGLNRYGVKMDDS